MIVNELVVNHVYVVQYDVVVSALLLLPILSARAHYYGVHSSLSIIACVGFCLLPLAQRPTAFGVSSERHWQSGINEHDKALNQRQRD